MICAVGRRRAGDLADVYGQFEPLVEAGKVAQQMRELLKSLKV